MMIAPLTILDIVVVASYYIEWAIKGSTVSSFLGLVVNTWEIDVHF